MPRRCSICSNERRAEIDLALVGNATLREIAQTYGVSKDALHRHRDHIPKVLLQASEAGEVEHGENLLFEVRELQERTLRLLTTAERTGDGPQALKAIREARENVKLLSQLGETKELAARIEALEQSAGSDAWVR